MFRDKLAEADMTSLVEAFDPERYNSQSSIGENLIFGTPLDETFNLQQLGSNPVLRKVLAENGLDAALFDMGKNIASNIIEIFEGLEADSPLFEQLSLMTPGAVPGLSDRAQAGRDRGPSVRLRRAIRPSSSILRSATSSRATGWACSKTTSWPSSSTRVIASTAPWATSRTRSRSIIPDRYNLAATIKDNVLMGRVAFGIAEAETRVTAMVREIIDELDAASRRVRGRTRIQHRQQRQAAERRPAPEAGHGARHPSAPRSADGPSRPDAAGSGQPGRDRGPHRAGGARQRRAARLRHSVEPGKRAPRSHFDRIIKMENGRVVEDSGVKEDDGVYADREPMRASA